MTLLAVVLVVTCLAAGAWATWSEHVARRPPPPRPERSHVRIVDVPYDWEEHDG
ncbi:MAG: hypothetical protein M0Z46_10675 [Actinomycetota bacterium]|nr:hypothetical protein [Actinomycetota bacterium]